MKYVDALIDDGAGTTVGRISGIDCAAIAAKRHYALAILVRPRWRDAERDAHASGKGLRPVLRHRGETMDEINPP